MDTGLTEGHASRPSFRHPYAPGTSITDPRSAPDAPANLFKPVPGDYGAHGRFDDQSRNGSWAMFTDRHKAVFVALAVIGGAAALYQVAKWLDI